MIFRRYESLVNEDLRKIDCPELPLGFMEFNKIRWPEWAATKETNLTSKLQAEDYQKYIDGHKREIENHDYYIKAYTNEITKFSKALTDRNEKKKDLELMVLKLEAEMEFKSNLKSFNETRKAAPGKDLSKLIKDYLLNEENDDEDEDDE